MMQFAVVNTDAGDKRVKRRSQEVTLNLHKGPSLRNRAVVRDLGSSDQTWQGILDDKPSR